MAHCHHRHFATTERNEPAAHFLCPITCRINHVLAANLAFFRADDPFVVFAFDTSRRTKADDFCACITRALGIGLSQLRRIDVAVVRIVQATFKIMRLKKRVAIFQIANRTHVDVHALISAHALDALEFLHPFERMCQAYRTGHVVVHRVVNRLRQSAVEFGGVTLHIHHRPRSRKRRYIARRMPG